MVRIRQYNRHRTFLDGDQPSAPIIMNRKRPVNKHIQVGMTDFVPALDCIKAT